MLTHDGPSLGRTASLSHGTRPLLAVALALVASAIVCFPSWPGYMSYDSLFAFKESIDGVITAVWPPLHAYLFFLSRKAGFGPGGLFYVQVFVLFLSVSLIINLTTGSIWKAIAGFFGFFLLFIYFPTIIGVAIVSWKDVTTASFSLLGLAIWLLAIRRRSLPLVVTAVIVFCAALALRYNSFPLIAGILFCMVVSPFADRCTRSDRVAVLAAIAIGMSVAYASTVWRLPDLKRLPPESGFAAIQEFDLMGIEVCSKRHLIPLEMSHGVEISAEQVAKLYDPRHVQLAFRDVPGIPRLIETDGGGRVQAKWREELPAEPLCYLSHRLAVFSWLMGTNQTGVFYPTHGGIDENQYGIVLANPKASLWVTSYVVSNANSPLRRPYILYLLATVAFIVTFYNRTLPRQLLIGIYAGLFGYPMALFFVAPAADARYIFPSNIFCLLLFVVAVLELIKGLQYSFRRRGAGSLAAGNRMTGRVLYCNIGSRQPSLNKNS